MLFTKRTRRGTRPKKAFLKRLKILRLKRTFLRMDPEIRKTVRRRNLKFPRVLYLRNQMTATTALCLNGTKIRSGIPPMI